MKTKNTYNLPAERQFVIDGVTYTGVNLIYVSQIYPKRETPKSYKRIGGFVTSNRGTYESGCVTVYKTRGGYAASLYKDGCFHEYFCKCELIPA